MTLLYLFSRDINFYSRSKVNNHLAFDGNMRDSSNYYKDEYEMEQGSNKGQFLKKIEWKDGRPYGFNRKLGEKVRFIALTEYAKILDEKKTVFKRVGNKIKSLIR